VASNLDQSEGENEMGFLDHVDVLRKHLFRCVWAILIMAIVAFVYNSELMNYIILGPKDPNFWAYRMMCQLGRYISHDDSMCVSAKDLDFKTINTDISGQFTQSIWISFMAGLILAFPFILYQLWLFIKPALKEKERKHARGLVLYCSLLFIVGVLFGYFMLTPVSVSFLSSYKMSEQIENYISIDSYISFVTSLSFGTGVVFELPILVYFLAKIGIMGAAFMRKYRRHAFLVILIIAAVVTPPDATSMILMTIPLYALYEISILVAYRVDKNKAKASTQ
jgi:sec-independent protein translocase protein TatC